MIVVTGATGNTARPAVENLIAHGQKVRVLGRSAEKLAEFAAKGAEPFVCDAADAASLTRAFTGADAVYAMIPMSPAAQNVLGYYDNISGALAAAILEGQAPGEAVAFANAAASLKCSRPGGRAAIPTRDEVERFLRGINSYAC